MADPSTPSMPTSVDAATEDRATFADSDLRVTGGWFNVPIRVVDLQVDLVKPSAALLSAEVSRSRDSAVVATRAVSPRDPQVPA